MTARAPALPFGAIRVQISARSARQSLPVPFRAVGPLPIFHVMDRYQTATRPWAGSSESVNDILWATYRWMSVGLAITGLVAWGVSHSPGALELFVGNRIVFYGLMFAQ